MESLNERQTIIPVGFIAIEHSKYDALRDDRAMCHNTLDVLRARILNTYIENKKKGYSATMYCTELADILGIKLPEVEREVASND